MHTPLVTSLPFLYNLSQYSPREEVDRFHPSTQCLSHSFYIILHFITSPHPFVDPLVHCVWFLASVCLKLF
ncbi:hypothetical protein PAXINDRAFT_165062 [Paxillus involutus ATCC 200175]|nr:hypothetical protein PAXINDRAFT_165062 [Paxillus involutus ATCC 200175]